MAQSAGGGAGAGGAGGGNGGATPPGTTSSAAVGSPNAQSPSYGVSSSTPTGSATSSNHYAGQGRETKTLNGQTVTGSTATMDQPSTTTKTR